MSWSELSSAASKGRLETVEKLLQSRAAAPADLREALACAAIYAHHEVMKFLVARGADPNAAEGTSGPALFFANKLATVRLLLSLGADPLARDSAGNDAVHWHLITNGPGSRRDSDVEIVRTLLDAGVDVRARNADRPHLLMACAAGNSKIIELLVERGAVLDARRGSDTVLSASQGSGRSSQILAVLARLGLAPNTTWKFAGTETSLLMELCRAGDLETVSFLLGRGADPNLGGTSTPLALAEASRNQPLVDLLLEKGARSPRRQLTAAALTELDAAERAVTADPASRLAHAAALSRHGFRAAAACEVFASKLAAPELLATPLAGWTISAAPMPEGRAVAPRIEDGRFPGAVATDGTHVAPLVMLFGAPCTSCDEQGETVCSKCDGQGSYSSYLDPDHDVICEPRQVCANCFGTHFAVRGRRAQGGCRHEDAPVEFRFASFTLLRCKQCGLAGLRGAIFSGEAVRSNFACADCAKFVCSCRG